LRLGEALDVVPHLLKHRLERYPYAGIVVDDVNVHAKHPLFKVLGKRESHSNANGAKLGMKVVLPD
jgi:hypothetical protein